MPSEKGGTVGARDLNGRNVLHTACNMESQQTLPILRMLLREGSPALDHINDEDQDGRTPLYYAVRNTLRSAPAVVRLLIGSFLTSNLAFLRDFLRFFRDFCESFVNF